MKKSELETKKKELKDEAVVLDVPPPAAAELETVLSRLAKAPGVKVNLTKLGREKLVQAALGLTAASRVLRTNTGD